MGKLTLWERMIEFIAGIGWWIFIKFRYNGDQFNYFDEYDDSVLYAIRLKVLEIFIEWEKDFSKDHPAEAPSTAYLKLKEEITKQLYSLKSGTNPNRIKAGDVIEIEEAWEDGAGNYHDEFPVVLGVLKDGRLLLKFDDKDVNKFLKDAQFFAKDYKPEK